MLDGKSLIKNKKWKAAALLIALLIVQPFSSYVPNDASVVKAANDITTLSNHGGAKAINPGRSLVTTCLKNEYEYNVCQDVKNDNVVNLPKVISDRKGANQYTMILAFRSTCTYCTSFMSAVANAAADSPLKSSDLRIFAIESSCKSQGAGTKANSYKKLSDTGLINSPTVRGLYNLDTFNWFPYQLQGLGLKLNPVSIPAVVLFKGNGAEPIARYCSFKTATASDYEAAMRELNGSTPFNFTDYSYADEYAQDIPYNEFFPEDKNDGGNNDLNNNSNLGNNDNGNSSPITPDKGSNPLPSSPPANNEVSENKNLSSPENKNEPSIEDGECEDCEVTLDFPIPDFSVGASDNVVRHVLASNTENPKKTSIKNVKAKRKSLKVTFAKRTKISGYEVQYSTSSDFKENTKTVKIKSAKVTSTTIKKLQSKTKYYVRVRTYRTVDGTKIYSGWSDKKSVKTKK